MNNFIKIILIGNINAGKSSLINAIFKQYLAEVSPVGGKTQEATSYNYDISFNGMNVKIVDTPGMSEVNATERSTIWKTEASSSDLVFFVISSDLTDNEFKAIEYLADVGKPIILVLNQIDRYTKEQLTEISSSINLKIQNLISYEDFIQVAAAPIQKLCIQKEDESEEWFEKYLESDIEKLTDRMYKVLQNEGKDLIFLNEFTSKLNVNNLKKMQDITKIKKEVEKTVEEYAIGTGIAIALNPIPFVDLMVSLGSFSLLVNKIGKHYGTKLEGDILGVYTENLIKEGMGQLKSYIAIAFGAALLKNIPFIGWAAGATVQGGVVGYLVYVLGLATSEYFANGKQWKEGESMRKTLDEIIKNTDKDTFSKKVSTRIKNKINAA